MTIWPLSRELSYYSELLQDQPETLLLRSGLQSNDLSFWWQKIGAARGLWEPTSPPEDLADLWADVGDTLDEVDDFIAVNAAALQSAHRITSGLGHRFSILASHERVGLWSLCPT